MKVWCVIENADGELNATVHLTQGGALIAALTDVLDFLKIESEAQAKALLKRWKLDERQEWDMDLIKELPPQELWKLWDFWSEFTWDTEFDITIQSRRLLP